MSRRRKASTARKKRVTSGAGRGYTKESLNMLKSKEGQLNDVFACFGSACQRGQLLEKALGDLVLVINQLVDSSLSLADLKGRDEKIRRKTMGNLFRYVKEHATISDESIVENLNLAINKRNFLAHRYFIERDTGFETRADRKGMITELVIMGDFIDQCTAVVRGINIAIRDTLYGVRNSSSSRPLFTVEIPTQVRIPPEIDTLDLPKIPLTASSH